ncbi:MAG: hypothetical protein JRJ00_12190 [Deltaproteobacteria bacterium]|jgi:hypothetical protein|nr:hypothetical protein [Deltaproteobacteria bacterium]
MKKFIIVLLAISFLFLASIPSAESAEVVILQCLYQDNTNEILVGTYNGSRNSPKIEPRRNCAQALARLISANFKIEYVNLQLFRFVLVKP